MKTHILHLEEYDDIVSACDRLAWAKSQRILIVWPEEGVVLHRPLDIILLKRKAEELGAQIAFVTQKTDILYEAPRLGIPVFKSVQQAQKDPWRVPRRFRKASATPPLDSLSPRPELPQKPPESAPMHPILRLLIFTVSVLAVLSMAFVLLPSAELNLTPLRITQEAMIQVRASPEQKEIHPAGIIPLHAITITVEGRASTETSGKVILPYHHASGEVIFTNLTDKSVLVPSGTIVRTVEQNPLRFIVTQQGEVPAGPGQSLHLPVRCLTAGSQGNVLSGRIQAIEGTLSTHLIVTNPEALSGGTDRVEPAPTEEDRRRLVEQLTRELEANALRELEHSIGKNDILIPGSLQVLQTLEAAFQPEEGQPAARLFLTLRLELEAMIISAQDLEDLARWVLDAQTPQGYIPADNTIAIQVNNTPSYTAGGEALLHITANRQLQAEIVEAQVYRLVLFQPITKAIKDLSDHLLLAKEPGVEIFPAWWPRLPFLPFRIQLTIR